MPRLGQFGVTDLPQTATIEAFRAGLAAAAGDDLAFRHSPTYMVSTTPGGLRFGVNLFGPGSSPVMTATATGESGVRGIVSVILNDCRFVASSMTLVDRHMRLFRNGIENLPNPQALASFDPNYHLESDGQLALDDRFATDAAYFDCVALPVCGLGMPNYGHFLYDGLPGVLLSKILFAEFPIKIVGQALKPWQRDILLALDLAQHYVEIQGPAVFRKVLTTTMLSLHVSYPSSFFRPVFDILRFRFGAGARRPDRQVFLSRAGDLTRRVLRNRDAVEGMLRAIGIDIVVMDRLPFAMQVRLMSECSLVIGESGAAMANLGFCQAGTKVLEIQPDRFVEGWTRSMCFMLAHQWHVYFAAVDQPPPDAPDANQTFSYEVDPEDLAQAVTVLRASLHR